MIPTLGPDHSKITFFVLGAKRTAYLIANFNLILLLILAGLNI